MKKDLPLVSIWCITYNHGKYLESAIESFLQQKTEFEYEIIIHDDASTDGTGEIIQKYVQKNPDRIKAIIQPNNLYSHLSIKDFQFTLESAMEEKSVGKYIALCEGDDFWIDKHKLQIQIDYMEEHPDCTMTAHNSAILDMENGTIIKVMNPYDCDKDLSMEEMIMWYHGNIPTASTVVRREYAVGKGFFGGTMESVDWARQLYCAVNGKVHYFDRIMSCYRANTQTSYSRTIWGNDRKRYGIRLNQMYFLWLFDYFTKGAYREFVSEKLYEILIMLFEENANSDLVQFRQICDEQGKEKGVKYNRFLDRVVGAFNLFKGCDLCVEYIKEFVKKHQHVLIMGDGWNGQNLANALLDCNLDFEGFVVSDGYKQIEKQCGKPVWELSKLPFDKSQCGVIVAMRFIYYPEVIQNLLKSGIKRYTYIYGIIGD